MEFHMDSTPVPTPREAYDDEYIAEDKSAVDDEGTWEAKRELNRGQGDDEPADEK